jgi:hypothetical protein
MCVRNMHKMLLITSILSIIYFTYTFQYSHISNYIYLSLLTFTLFETHVSFSKKTLLHLVCQTTSAGNHMLLNYGIQDELMTYLILKSEGGSTHYIDKLRKTDP